MRETIKKTDNSLKLKELIQNGSLWAGPALPNSTLDIPPTYRSQEDLDLKPHSKQYSSILNIKSTIQEIFLETGIEDRARNIWLPAYGFICESLQDLRGKENISIAWICNRFYPNLDFLCSSHLKEMIHLVFLPEKKNILSLINKTIQANCFTVIVACIENLSFSQTRSLKLRSKNTNSINLILRPPWEKEEHSASFIKHLIIPNTETDLPDLRTKNKNIAESKSHRRISWSNKIIRLKTYEDLKYR